MVQNFATIQLYMQSFLMCDDQNKKRQLKQLLFSKKQVVNNAVLQIVFFSRTKKQVLKKVVLQIVFFSKKRVLDIVVYLSIFFVKQFLDSSSYFFRKREF